MRAPDLEHPPTVAQSVLRLSLIELWERYSFFTLFALLPLFVAAPIAQGGFGWSAGDSLRFFGAYLLVVQVSPIAGGYIADRWLTPGLALLLGAGFLLAGQLVLTGVSLFTLMPAGSALAAAATGAGAPLATLGGAKNLSADAAATNSLLTIGFGLSVLFVAIGNGFMKPTLTAVVGRLPHPDEGSRNSAFTTYFLYLNAGALGSLLVGGWLAQELGWSAAFGMAAAGMVCSLLLLARYHRRHIAPYAAAAEASDAPDQADGDARIARWLPGFAALLLLFITACAFSYQSYGFVTLFTDKLVDRTILGFVVPATWFLALNPITIILLGPLVARFWAGRGAGWTASMQFAASFFVIGSAFLLLALAAFQARSGLASPVPVALAIIVIAGSELLFTPTSNATATRMLPPKRQGLGLGLLVASAGIGAWFSGRVGALATEGDTAVVVFTSATTALLFGAALLLIRRRAGRLGL